MLRYVRVEFHRFKAFDNFSLSLRQFNIVVGPNNAGKSTVLAAFRILAAGLRKANSRRPALIRFNGSTVRGYDVDLSSISVAEENLFYNYDDDEPAWVRFTLSNKSTLTLYFPEREVCYLVPEGAGRVIETPSAFKKYFDCPVGFVPILGPVDHHEPLFEKEAARLALFNYRAARNFRNIWHHYPEKFDEFRELLRQTWPGMDVEAPEIDTSHNRPLLHMYCPEKRIPREIFWAGFGFQVWCQMLTHIIQGQESSIFLIDEPDIYLHSELQRQLLSILKTMGPDVLIATHSTEIVTEAEANDLVLVSKANKSAKRLKDPTQIASVLKALGSSVNPVLTQLAKTRRAVFVEGKDFQIIGRFALRLGEQGVGNRRDFAVVPTDGFNPERVKNLISGIEATLGLPIMCAIVLDGDFRCAEERTALRSAGSKVAAYSIIHDRNEIENFLLVPSAIDRALKRRLEDRERRTGSTSVFSPLSSKILATYAESCRIEVQSRLIAERKQFEKHNNPKLSDASINAAALKEFDELWATEESRLKVVPGKEALAALNQEAQSLYSVSVTPLAIIDAMTAEEIPNEMKSLVATLQALSADKLTEGSVGSA